MKTAGEVDGRGTELSGTVAGLGLTEADWAHLPLTSASSCDWTTSFWTVGGWPGIVISQPCLPLRRQPSPFLLTHFILLLPLSRAYGDCRLGAISEHPLNLVTWMALCEP